MRFRYKRNLSLFNQQKMSDTNKLALIREMLDNAEKQIRSARRLVSELAGDGADLDLDFVQSRARSLAAPQISDDSRVIEGAFDGQNMIDTTGRSYPVPANYASKSKLVVGDHMKLTITEDGKFIYKQIGPVERDSVIGPLTYENGQYKVLANGKSYKILLASVTFFRADVGDEVTILIPSGIESEWGALDAVLPKTEV